MKKGSVLVIGIVISLIAILTFLNSAPIENESFSINTIFLKLNIPSGGEFVKTIKITNQEDEEQNFNLYFNNFIGLATVRNGKFSLGVGESREVEVHFKDYNKEIGIYPGKLIIETQTLKKEIPVILNIEDENSIFVISQTSIPKYDNVYPGGKFGIEIKIFNLQAYKLHNIEVKYSIKNLDNELITEDHEELVIEESFGTTKIIDIPEDTPYENYIFITSIDYGGTTSAEGHLFSISKRETNVFLGDFKFFIAVILIFVVGILILFIYFIKTREDLLLQLRRQQGSEVKRNIKAIENYKTGIKKLKNLKERKRKIGELEKVKKKIIGKTKTKQKRQNKQLRKLRKIGKKREMKETIEKWRKEGYKMPGIEKEMKKFSKGDMGKQIKDWKRKGYDTGALENK